MDFVDQLWILKQTYGDYKNRFYDSEKDLNLYRIPNSVSADETKKLEQSGRMPNQIIFPEHDAILEELDHLSSTWTLSEAANAFIAGLWSAPFLWKSALSAKCIALAMPKHQHTPYGNSVTTCAICGFRSWSVDITKEWYQRMTGGTPLDGEPVGHVLALQEMEKLGVRPVPTEYDIWIFRAILTVIRNMPPKSRYSKVRDMLCKEKLLPTSNKWVYGSLLETLALIGVLDTKDYPGMITQFTTYHKRDERPSVRVEVQAPLAWWDSSIGINEAALKKMFIAIDCSSVSLPDRPAAVIPLLQTVTGGLGKKRLPQRTFPKSPDAGKGPVQAGDVYAVCVREDAWVTFYCHRIEKEYVIVEFLEGIFSEMPMKSQINSTVQPRYNGQRWQGKVRVSEIDKTTGVRRVARNIPVPTSSLPEPDRIGYERTIYLSHSAEWCFREL